MASYRTTATVFGVGSGTEFTIDDADEEAVAHWELMADRGWLVRLDVPVPVEEVGKRGRNRQVSGGVAGGADVGDDESTDTERDSGSDGS